jgi:hypothetical protein
VYIDMDTIIYYCEWRMACAYVKNIVNIIIVNRYKKCSELMHNNNTRRFKRTKSYSDLIILVFLKNIHKSYLWFCLHVYPPFPVWPSNGWAYLCVYIRGLIRTISNYCCRSGRGLKNKCEEENTRLVYLLYVNTCHDNTYCTYYDLYGAIEFFTQIVVSYSAA